MTTFWTNTNLLEFCNKSLLLNHVIENVPMIDNQKMTNIVRTNVVYLSQPYDKLLVLKLASLLKFMILNNFKNCKLQCQYSPSIINGRQQVNLKNYTHSVKKVAELMIEDLVDQCKKEFNVNILDYGDYNRYYLHLCVGMYCSLTLGYEFKDDDSGQTYTSTCSSDTYQNVLQRLVDCFLNYNGLDVYDTPYGAIVYKKTL